MKKFLTVVLTLGLFTVSASGFSPISASAGSISDNVKIEAVNNPVSIGRATTVADLKKSHPRIYKNLSRFEKLQNLYVSNFEKFISVYCQIEGINHRFTYDNRGRLMHTIKFYKEDRLNKDVRHIVKREYYDFQIFGITEVIVGLETVYLVTLQDENSWVTIKVQNNEMETHQRLLKN